MQGKCFVQDAIRLRNFTTICNDDEYTLMGLVLVKYLCDVHSGNKDLLKALVWPINFHYNSNIYAVPVCLFYY